MIQIDRERCTGCGACARACPEQLLTASPRGGETVTWDDADVAAYCLRCGHCAVACPAGAMTVDGVTMMTPAAPVAQDALLGLLRSQRSGRQYTGEPVSRAHLAALLDAAATAPSAKNFRPVKAYVYTDPPVIAGIRAATLACYQRLAGLFRLPGAHLLYRLLGFPAALRAKLMHDARFLTDAGESDPLLHHAPALLAFTAPRGWAPGIGDAWLAAHNAVLYAETIPIATCYNGFVAQAAGMDGHVRRTMGVPSAERIVVVLTLGYPAARPRAGIARPPLATVWG